MIVSLIAAYANDGAGRKAIGKGNKIPWDSPSDMKRFREITTGHVIIMGRKTLESIGRALPKRTNIVITRDPNYSFPGVDVVNSVEDAFSLTKATDLVVHEIFVIGGEEIYKQTLQKADRLYLTNINCPDVKGADAFFPIINPLHFREIHKEIDENGDIFTVQQRVSSDDSLDIFQGPTLDNGFNPWYNYI